MKKAAAKIETIVIDVSKEGKVSTTDLSGIAAKSEISTHSSPSQTLTTDATVAFRVDNSILPPNPFFT
jgi:hypothetical protein